MLYAHHISTRPPPPPGFQILQRPLPCCEAQLQGIPKLCLVGLRSMEEGSGNPAF